MDGPNIFAVAVCMVTVLDARAERYREN